jgi:hypothetical protein
MNTQVRAKYQVPKLEVQRLRELPSALAQSGCRISESNGHPHPSCSTSGTGKQPMHFLSN